MLPGNAKASSTGMYGIMPEGLLEMIETIERFSRPYLNLLQFRACSAAQMHKEQLTSYSSDLRILLGNQCLISPKASKACVSFVQQGSENAL
jgi:hypothetical protein